MRISLLTIATFTLLLGHRFGLVSSVGPGFVENGLTRFLEQLPPEHLTTGESTSTHLHALDLRSYFAVPGSSSLNTVFPDHQQALNTGELGPRLTQYHLASSSNLPVHGSPLSLEIPRSHWQMSDTPMHHDGRLASYDREPIHNVLHTPYIPQHITDPASFQSQLWSPTSSLKIDSAIPNPLLSQNAQKEHQGLAIGQGTDTHATSEPMSTAKRWRRNGAPWSEDEKARWVRQRMSYSKQEPHFLRLLPYVFPEQPWLKRAKMQVWERPLVQQYIASQSFDDQLTWVNLEDLPRMRRILRKRSPAVRPSRILPSVSVSPAEAVKEIVEQVPHNVYVTDHGYRGRYRDGKVAGTPLESKPYYGLWALPKNPAKDNFMYFLGMGYLDLAPKTSPVQVLSDDASRSEREGTPP